MGGFIGYTQTPHTLTDCAVNGNIVDGKYAGAYYGTYNMFDDTPPCKFNNCAVDGEALTIKNFCGRNCENKNIIVDDQEQTVTQNP